PPAHVRLAMLEIRRFFAVLELRAFLYEQFHKFRMLKAESEKRSNRTGDSFNRIGHVGELIFDMLAESTHDPIGGGQKQLSLGREVSVERALTDFEPGCQFVSVRVREAALREKPGRDIQNLLAAAFLPFGNRKPAFDFRWRPHKINPQTIRTSQYYMRGRSF